MESKPKGLVVVQGGNPRGSKVGFYHYIKLLRFYLKRRDKARNFRYDTLF